MKCYKTGILTINNEVFTEENKMDAEDLCEQDLTYNLYTHNCGMVVQEIFAQADIDFAPQTGASYKERWKHVLFSKPEKYNMIVLL